MVNRDAIDGTLQTSADPKAHALPPWRSFSRKGRAPRRGRSREDVEGNCKKPYSWSASSTTGADRFAVSAVAFMTSSPATNFSTLVEPANEMSDGAHAAPRRGGRYAA